MRRSLLDFSRVAGPCLALPVYARLGIFPPGCGRFRLSPHVTHDDLTIACPAAGEYAENIQREKKKRGDQTMASSLVQVAQGLVCLRSTDERDCSVAHAHVSFGV